MRTASDRFPPIQMNNERRLTRVVSFAIKRVPFMWEAACDLLTRLSVAAYNVEEHTRTSRSFRKCFIIDHAALTQASRIANFVPGLVFSTAMHVTIYTKPGCPLCDEALLLVDKLTPRFDIEMREVNILEDMAVYEQYKEAIPVVEVTDARVGRVVAPISEAELVSYFELVRGVIERQDKGGTVALGSVLPDREPVLDRMGGWISKHWVKLIVGAMSLFVGIPWLAPLFAAFGWWDVANPIYTAYALLCHQLPERAGTVFGYPTASCFRCTALYGGVALFGIFYGLARNGGGPMSFLRKAVPWWGFALMLLPMTMDGVTHMFGLREGFDWTMDTSFGSFFIGSQPFSLNWWLRVTTGLLAALGAVWFAFPRMQRAVDEAEALRLLYAKSRAMRRDANATELM